MKGVSLTEAVGIRIKALLREQNITQYYLCKTGGIPRATVNLIVNGRVKSPQIDTIYQIAATLGISLQEFFDDPIFDEVTD